MLLDMHPVLSGDAAKYKILGVQDLMSTFSEPSPKSSAHTETSIYLHRLAIVLEGCFPTPSQMTTTTKDPIPTVIDHLQNVLEGRENPDWEILKPAYDLVGALPPSSVILLVEPLVAILLQGTAPDLEYIVRLLDEVVLKVKLSAVLEKIPLDTILVGLNSPDINLVKSCIRLVSKADIPDRAADPRVIRALIELQLQSATRVESTSALVVLINSTGIARRELFGASNGNLLEEVRSKEPGMVMELIEASLPFDDVAIESNLLQFDLETDDILLCLNVLAFYTRLVSTTRSGAFIAAIPGKLTAIFRLYNHEDKGLYQNGVYEFFRALSTHEPEVFFHYDKQFSLIADHTNDMRLFEYVDPTYLATYADYVKELKLRNASLDAFCNLISTRASYELLDIDSGKIMALTVEARLFLINAITSTPWGSSDLLSKWPQIMTYLMNAQIYEPNIRATAINIMENLLLRFTSITNSSVWHDPIKKKWKELTGSIDHTPQAIVAT